MYGCHQSSKLSYATSADSTVSWTVRESGGIEQFGEVTLAGSVEIGLGVRRWIDGYRGAPEIGDRRTSTGVVPHAGRDHPAGSDDTTHLAEPDHWVGHEVDDELGEGDVEATVVERQLLGTRLSHVDAGVPFAGRGDERSGRIDGANGCGAEARDESGRQRSRAAPDIERRLVRAGHRPARASGPRAATSSGP